MLGFYTTPSAGPGRLKEPPMQNDPHRSRHFFAPTPNPALRQRRMAAMGTAAALVLVGLGAFALVAARAARSRPPVPPTMLAAAANDARAPRMLENSSPFSFADLVERVSPAVVTVRSRPGTTDDDAEME